MGGYSAVKPSVPIQDFANEMLPPIKFVLGQLFRLGELIRHKNILQLKTWVGHDNPSIKVRTVIEKWKSRLAKYGFKPDPEHPYASVLVRRFKFLEQSIFEVKLRLSNYRESNIRLGIGYTDLFKENPFRAILLQTDLRRSEPPKLHAPGTLWTQSDERAALRSLLQFGIPWLDHYGKPKVLINCLEKHLKETNARGDHEDLGLLYYEMGLFRKACEHTQAWLDHIPRTRSWVGERARTRRQLKAMKCGRK